MAPGSSNVLTMLESNIQEPPRNELSLLPWCIDRVGDVELPEHTVPLAASATALNITTTLDFVLAVSNAKPPPNQVLAATNPIAQLRDKATYK